jgi:hypothetical protein
VPDQIQFEGERQKEKLLYGRFAQRTRVPAMVRWALSTGIVQDERSARYLLLAVAVGAVVLAFIIPSFIGGHLPTVKDFSQTNQFSPAVRP